ncbi:hypothetical protein [Carnobacterium maltaromaticum]|uniref:hypothetical protein n=1 Tax=Carnobacterium maltaromaticum TaxID=2751 RepID=UPI0018D32E7E|nr:hypothetical protein [Carnobacterium maltaromaticum]
MKKVKAPLDKNNVFMFSSVHNWMDTRILKKEAFSLIKSGKSIEFYAIGNQEEAPFIEGIQFHLMKKGKKWSRPFKWFFLMKKALRSRAKYYHFHDAELLCLAPLIRKKNLMLLSFMICMNILRLKLVRKIGCQPQSVDPYLN